MAEDEPSKATKKTTKRPAKQQGSQDESGGGSQPAGDPGDTPEYLSPEGAEQEGAPASAEQEGAPASADQEGAPASDAGGKGGSPQERAQTKPAGQDAEAKQAPTGLSAPGDTAEDEDEGGDEDEPSTTARVNQELAGKNSGDDTQVVVRSDVYRGAGIRVLAAGQITTKGTAESYGLRKPGGYREV